MSQDYAALAQRYQQAALDVTHPEAIRYYLDKAAEYEVLAKQANASTPARPVEHSQSAPQQPLPTEPEPVNPSLTTAIEKVTQQIVRASKELPSDTPDNEQPVNPDPFANIPSKAIVHSHLATAIVAGKEYARPYALWVVLRSLPHDGKLDKDAVITFAMDETGNARSTAYEWLAAGEGIFWKTGKGKLFLIGKARVFDLFLGKNVKPGKLTYVPVELLLNHRLHVVKSNLHATWITKDEGQIAARITRKNAIQGIPESTQRTYDATAQVPITPIFLNETKESQVSNHYSRPSGFTTRHDTGKDDAVFYGHRASEFNAAARISTPDGWDAGCWVEHPQEANGGPTGQRIYFRDQRRAVEEAKYRTKHDIPVPVRWIHVPNEQTSKKGLLVTEFYGEILPQ